MRNCVIVVYGLFNTTNFIQNVIYILFGIILTEFYINFSRQEHQIDVLYVLFKTWDSQVSAYTPFHFSFTVPLRKVATILILTYMTIYYLRHNFNMISDNKPFIKLFCVKYQFFLTEADLTSFFILHFYTVNPRYMNK